MKVHGRVTREGIGRGRLQVKQQARAGKTRRTRPDLMEEVGFRQAPTDRDEGEEGRLPTAVNRLGSGIEVTQSPGLGQAGALSEGF